MIQSNRLVTDSSGDVENEFKSLPFGQEVKNEGIRYAFATGKELDESELHYFGARYYDSNVGRFTSVDPIQSEPAYQYVRNSPLILIDPNGDFPFSVLSEMMIPHPTLNEYDSLSEAMNSAKKNGFIYPKEIRYATSRYGLLDVSGHVDAKFAGNTIDAVFNAYKEGQSSGKMESFEVSMGGSSPKSLRYSMQVKLDDSLLDKGASRDDLLSIAFGMFTSLSHGFEDAQGEHSIISGHRYSSYANEDMRSNYLSFFISANDLDFDSVLWNLGVNAISPLDSSVEKKSFSIFKGLFMPKSRTWPTNFPSWVEDNMPEENYADWETLDSNSVN